VIFENNINQSKVVGIWRSNDGIYLSNGQAPFLVSHDIESVFDQTSATHVNLLMIDREYSFIDQQRLEYHWLWASGSSSTLDKEYVLDLKKWRWFEINRSKESTAGTYVIDDDCTSLTGWAQSVVGSGASVEVSNGFHLITGSSASAIAILRNTSTVFPTKFSVTLKTKFITLGTFADQDFYIFSMFGTLATPLPKRFAMIFSSDKLTLGMYSDENIPVLFNFGAPGINVDETWVFEFDRSAGDDATTVEVFVNGASQGTETFDSLGLFTSASPLVAHVLYGTETPSTECYIKETSIINGLSSEDITAEDIKLQCGLNVVDTYGNNYQYGFIDTGYTERLENGTDFDGIYITSTLEFGGMTPVSKNFAV
jgi:hypothetical protein